MAKALLFDLDGVLTLPEEVFSVIYSRTYGHDLAPFTTFFQTEWADFVTGKKDLREHIKDNPQFWKWNKTPEELLEFWFKAEDVRNQPLLELIYEARKKGLKCYVVTEQERYRTAYIRNFMFKHDLDGVFSTAEIGFKKKDPHFFKKVVELLKIKPTELIYFDDSQSKLDAATAIGIQSYLYKNPSQVANVIEHIEPQA